MLSFLVMLACSFVFVRRRYPVGYAFAALLILAHSSLLELGVTAKAYSFELAMIALALVCWQSAARGQGRPWSVLGVWLGLGCALLAHAFAIFMLLPFAAAQLVRDYRRGRVDVPLWLAILLFPVTLLPVLRGERLAARFYGSSFWAQPQLGYLLSSYKAYIGWHYVVVGLIGVFALGLAMTTHRQSGPQSEPPAPEGFSLPEWVLISALAALPLYALPASYLIHVYRELYVSPVVVGLTLLLIAATGEGAGRSRLGGAIVFLFSCIALPGLLASVPAALRAMAHPAAVHTRLQQRYNDQPWMRLVESGSLPIVTDEFAVDYYAEPAWKHRLFYLTHISVVERYPGSSTVQHNWLLFGSLLSYRTMDIDEFLPGHPRFLLITSTDRPASWLESELLKQQQLGHVTLQLLGPDFETPAVYDVRFTAPLP
jgi:hypothetical protein